MSRKSNDWIFWVALIGGALALLTGGVAVIAPQLLPNALKDLIARFEGFSLTPYQDSAGIWTIGYGHKIVAGDPWYPVGTVHQMTQEQADAVLAADTYKAQQAVAKYVKVPLTDNQISALTSLVFNIGAGNFANSTLLKKLNAGDYDGAADQFDVWNKTHVNGVLAVVDGLVNRRADEKDLFLTA